MKSTLIDLIASNYDNEKYEEILDKMIKIESGEKNIMDKIEKIKELNEKVENGEFDDNELIDLLIHYRKENSILKNENKRISDAINEIDNMILEFNEQIDKMEKINRVSAIAMIGIRNKFIHIVKILKWGN